MDAITVLLCVKGVITVATGWPVIAATRSVLNDLNFKVVTAGHLHMTKLWGVWMCFFQAPLELSFAFYVRGHPRNLFLAVETLFEISLYVEVVADRRRANAAHYSASVECAYLVTVIVFLFVLLNHPDPIHDKNHSKDSYIFLCGVGAWFLTMQLLLCV